MARANKTKSTGRAKPKAKSKPAPLDLPAPPAPPGLGLLTPAAADLLLVLCLVVVPRPERHLSTIFTELTGHGMAKGKRRQTRGPQAYLKTRKELVDAGFAYRIEVQHEQFMLRAPPEIVAPVIAHAHQTGRIVELWPAWQEYSEYSRLSEGVYLSFANGEHTYIGSPQRLGELRIGLELGHAAVIDRALEHLRRSHQELCVPVALTAEPPAHWLRALPPWAVLAHLRRRAPELILEGRLPSSSMLELAKEAQDKEVNRHIAYALAFAGRLGEALDFGKLPRWAAEGCELIALFARGDYEAAASCGDGAVARMKQRKHKQFRFFPGLVHAWVRAATMASNPTRANAFRKSIENTRAIKEFGDCYAILGRFSELSQISQLPKSPPESLGSQDDHEDWCGELTSLLCRQWLGYGLRETDKAYRKALVAHTLPRLRASGYEAIAREFDALVEAEPLAAKQAGHQVAEPSLAAAFVRREPWELIVDTFEATAHSLAGAAGSERPESTFREHLVWHLSLFEGQAFELEARHISSARAKKGKRVAGGRLRKGALSFMSEADLKLSSHLHERQVGWYGKTVWEFAPEGLKALIGHPHVLLNGKDPVQIVAGQPSIEVKTSGGLTSLTLNPAQLQGMKICALQVAPDTIEIHERSEALGPVYKLFAHGNTLKVPDSGRARVLESLANLSVTTGLHVSGEDSLQHKGVDADSDVALRLSWDGRVFTIDARCAPLGLEGPLLPVANGHKEVVGRIDGELRRCTRDLPAEALALDQLLAGCPQLASYPEQDGRWEIDQLDTALTLLEEFGALRPPARMVWPQGKRLQLAPKVDSASMKVSVKTGKKWLEAQVELTLDDALHDSRVLGFKELLARRRSGGRFIELDDDRYAALTADLKKRLDALEALGVTRASKVELHPVKLALFDDLVIGERGALGSVSFDKASQERLKKLDKIAASRPRLPRGFGLTLRDYQAESYRWLVRLGEAGLGAVLADDMGLGKTIQALALLLKRRATGPALVVAPTSVVRNWREEARRCTPSLRAHLLSESSDRHALLQGAKAGDLILCSYGLLVSEAEQLRQLEFGTIVFDEAHALKNTRAQRSQVAHDLNAGFRLSLTGTPVENHLGELWSVMQASVPGLLGSEAAFDRRFVKPIASGVRERSRALRALIHPFVLRRTKGQVLDELPERTEMTVLVEPGPAERAFYEALRQQAQGLLASKGNTRQAKANRLRILAEITRLRQAAVDPRLIDPEHGPPGAKIKALIERLLDLKAEGHRALVFTQFRGSLHHARLAMDAAGIEHLGFEGSTPAKARAQAVDAFQGGEADVFLMSLKAGGVGINLTAADYVIHLDPWWNPAVEDQATSRAHRIGQQRPVTVYRLINEGTIEEKILALHETKRDLADDILAGLENTGKLDLEQLRALLSD